MAGSTDVYVTYLLEELSQDGIRGCILTFFHVTLDEQQGRGSERACQIGEPVAFSTNRPAV